MERAFKGIWIPKEIWLEKELNWVEKILLVEIASLDNEQGCWASNAYFAEFFSLSKNRISILINSLKEKGYVTVELQYKAGTKQIEKRIIRNTYTYMRKQIGGITEKEDTPICENAKDNNTSFNNTINNTKDTMSGKPDNVPYEEIIEYLNQKSETNFRSKTASTRKHIKARFNEGFTIDDFKTVIDKKTKEWKGDEKWGRFLRPETLFGTKFEGYLNQKEKNQRGNGYDTSEYENFF